jgi:hypothetical protein
VGDALEPADGAMGSLAPPLADFAVVFFEVPDPAAFTDLVAVVFFGVVVFLAGVFRGFFSSSTLIADSPHLRSSPSNVQGFWF